MKQHPHDLCFRVLAYKEDGDFVAHALEADLLGYGSTEAEALKDLLEALEAQISFAIQMNDLSLIQKNAPQEVFDKWNEAHQAKLNSQFKAISSGDKRQTRLNLGSRKTAVDAGYYGFSTDELVTLGNNRLEPCFA